MRFETIGNATIIAYEGDKPVLATDPWIQGSAYFGSWKLSHEIPQAQLDAIKSAKYVWFSHGHPDHINAESLLALSDRTILLPDHVGGRMKKDLTEQGLNVQVLPERTWVQLSEHIRVMCVSDYNQDALLLIDVNGRLVANFNDGNALGSESFVKKIIKQFPRSFMLRLFSYGDADMINYFLEDGTRILPPAAQKRPVGPIMQGYAEMYGVTDVIPFSCFHTYQRKDSDWVNEYITPMEAFSQGFTSTKVRLLPAFISYDCVTDQYKELHPPVSKRELIDPSVFGDDWSEQLTPDEEREIRAYFLRMEALRGGVDRIVLRVGGKETAIDITNTNKQNRRIVYFDVPRGSLLTAIRYEVFDDLLIGNFMKTTLVGDWPASRLYPHFNPLVGKYADNGKAYTKQDLQAYFNAYKSRAPFDFTFHRLQQRSIQTFRNVVSPQSPAFVFGKRTYFAIKKHF